MATLVAIHPHQQQQSPVSFNDIGVLFSVRSKLLRAHAGEVAFPGGIVDPTDASPLAASLREVHEEIGVESSSLLVLGALPPMPDRQGRTEVFPFVSAACWMPLTDNDASSQVAGDIRRIEDIPEAQLDSLVLKTVDDLNMKLNPDELMELLDPSKRSEEEFRGMKGIKIPTWYGPNDERIWGLTAFVLDHFLKQVIVPAMQPGVRA
ncbi:nudix (nucleoside diphosphate linked moiety X)-type motif 8 [Rhizoclosmatium sp. JEL0117]|nr:nudix (nucleoside diphosphate linked moiety X)-type motif 8 [Rhizoclosmatium sp. JEL0117]